MITYHNAGNAGRGYSRLELRDPSCGEDAPMVEFMIDALDPGPDGSVRLNIEQIRHMCNVLTGFLVKHAADVRPMIEGTSL
jgi:hypothetical protein